MMDVEYLNSIEEVGFVVVDEEEICDVEQANTYRMLCIDFIPCLYHMYIGYTNTIIYDDETNIESSITSMPNKQHWSS